MVNLRQLINSKLAGIAEQWQEIIDPGAKQGQTIEIESRRQKIELSKAAYPAPDRDACIMEMDSPLESLPVKYGNHIPSIMRTRLCRILKRVSDTRLMKEPSGECRRSRS